ncbi:hypothetical protein CGRA01v4_09023 [Colletotrichum graminicola]|nr:hypothetical protein CGRA01v4_09023 [Colletotrichum graminicola]
MIAGPIDPYPTQPKFTSSSNTYHSYPFTFTKQPNPTLKFCIQIRLRAHRLVLPMRRLPCLRCTAFCFPFCKPLPFLPPFALLPRANLDEAKKEGMICTAQPLLTGTNQCCAQPNQPATDVMCWQYF